jgi:hypothetical protein
MEKIEKYNEFTLNEMNNERELLPKMIQVSNNSPLTNIVCNSLVEKLDQKEFRDFKEWLRLIENNKNNNSGRDRYGYSF